jgi:electron transfer flavoprotein-quinone oxidoreductase
VYPRILDEVLPKWWEEAPVQRWVTRRSTMLLTDASALTIDYRSARWGAPPYNGATAFRPDWDHWLSGKAVDAGATLVCDTTVVGLIRDATGAVTGVRTDRPDGDLTCRVVVACDGVNSFLAKEAGLYPHTDASNFTLGVKETLSLPKEVIDERFGVRDRQGVDIEILGGTSGVNGGGFLYTNLDTVALGVVLKLPKLAAQQTRPEEIIAKLKSHAAIAPLVEGAELKEYSAHLIPEAGLKMMPTMVHDGMLVAGDAAALCLAAGIWLEGVNFAMASGLYAGRAAAEAIAANDVTRTGLDRYRQALSDTFVLRDHRRLRRVPQLVLSDRVQHLYPELITGVVERVFRVDNPLPKPGLRRILAQERKRVGARRRDLVRDAWDGLRSFG